MIKSTYLLPAALLLLASCSQESPTEEYEITNPERIHFRSSLPQITRGGVVTKDDLRNFYITAFNPYDETLTDADGNLTEYVADMLVEKDDASGFFTSADCLWPDKRHEGDELSFFAYYPDRKDGMTLENASTVAEGVADIKYSLKNFSIPRNIAEHVDFITAYSSGSMAANMFSGIPLEFQHQLSRIELMAKGAPATTYTSNGIEIAGLRIGEVHRQGTFNFKPEESGGNWTLDADKGIMEYIYQKDDKIVSLTSKTTTAVSIMGNAGSAMLFPSAFESWDFANDNTNTKKGLYLSVLIRVLDSSKKVQYPYSATSGVVMGPDYANIPRIYFAVNKSSGIISDRVYRKSGSTTNYSDEACTVTYKLLSTDEIREYGWAAVPVADIWEAGTSYTYTLDFSSGVGLHAPDAPGSGMPKAGDPIFSDQVGLTVTVVTWGNGANTTVKVPGE